MKLLDKLFPSRGAIQALADGLKAVAEKTGELAQNVAILHHNQAVHHHLITQMWQAQQLIYAKLQEHSLDTKMPAIKGKVDPKNDKPN